jgi:alpha-tubulin suppressor-like RCC1 family protein
MTTPSSTCEHNRIKAYRVTLPTSNYFLNVPVLVFALVLATLTVRAQSNLVLLNSSPGDPVGNGQIYATENPANFSVSGTPAPITISAFGFTFYFASPDGTSLTVGNYPNSARWPFNNTSPGLDITGNGVGCNTDCGSFQINELQLNGAGQVVRLWLTYSNQCDCSYAPMSGEIRINSTLAPPIIVVTQQPTNQMIYSGNNAVINVSALGSAPMYYNWYLNGTNIATTTNGQLIITNVQVGNAGVYSVRVTNNVASASFSDFVLAVTNVPPVILVQPTDFYGALNSNAVLSVQAVGSKPMIYQWRFNSNNTETATNATLVIANLQSSNQGPYDVILSNPFGSITSSPAYIKVTDMSDFNAALNTTNLLWSVGGDAPWFVQPNPTLTVNPWGLYPYSVTHDGFASMQSGNTLPGQSSYLQAVIVGPATLNFWWQAVSESSADYLALSVNGIEQARISSIAAWQQRTFYLGAGSNYLQWSYIETDSSTSAQAAGWVDQVNVISGGTTPFVTLAPVAQVVLLGSNATLTAAASGTPPLNYQWQLNGTNLTGATSTNLVLISAQFTNEGNYTLVISNAVGVTTTTPIFINVMDFTESLNATNLVWNTGGNQPWFPETSITHDGVAALQSGGISGNQLSTVSTTVSGPGTLSFWWKVSSETNNDYIGFLVDGTEQTRISGTVNWQQKVFYLTSRMHTLAWSYTKNATINSGSDAAWLDQVSYVSGATSAFAVSGPTDQIVRISTNATFAVTAGGTPPITYQWMFDGGVIAGATNASLTVTNVQAANAGIYAVAITNDYGGAASTNANLYLLSVYAWGAGQSNTIATPNYGQCIVPANLLAVTAIAAGGYHSLALRSNGTVVAWGYNSYNQTNVPSTLTNATAVAAGLFHSMALRSNGTVAVWGNSSYSQTTVPASATNVTAIASGWYHCLALRSNGTVVAWGAGTSQGLPPNYGQSIVPNNLTNVAAIASGAYHSLALRTNGTVVAWGWNAFGQTNVPLGLSNVIAIAAGGSNSVALKSDGTLVTWGANGSGQTNVPSGLTNVVAISCGAAHDMALRNDGTLVVWGLNGNGQTNIPSGLTNIVRISAGAYHSMAVINIGPITSLGQPMRQTNYTASTVVLTSRAFGALPLSYQWQFNGTNIDGATNAWLILTNLPFSAAGSYSCIASNSYGAATNLITTLTVLRSTPWFNPVGGKLTGDGFGLEVDRLSGHGIIVIYASSNLVDWFPILTNSPQVGTLELVDPNATNMPAGFYRAQEY